MPVVGIRLAHKGLDACWDAGSTGLVASQGSIALWLQGKCWRILDRKPMPSGSGVGWGQKGVFRADSEAGLGGPNYRSAALVECGRSVDFHKSPENWR